MNIFNKIKNKLAKPRREVDYLLPEHPLVKKDWYQTYTFSYNGIHFNLDAESHEMAWGMARRIAGQSSGLFLIMVSGMNLNLTYLKPPVA